MSQDQTRCQDWLWDHVLTGWQGHFFKDIFNLFLKFSKFSVILKASTIVPLPKMSAVTCLSVFFPPVALSPVIMKCFERIFLRHIKNSLPADPDRHQFAFKGNRSTQEAVYIALHIALTNLGHPDNYFRMLFVDFSSAFNTIISNKLIMKLLHLGLSTSVPSGSGTFSSISPRWWE